MNVTDQIQYDWIELSRKTFEFACYSRYWLATGDVKTKTQILQLLGQNLKLYDKKIQIDESNLFWFIEKTKKEVDSLVNPSEPTKKASFPGVMPLGKLVIPSYLRD